MKPLKQNTTIDTALSNISVKYSNDRFAADEILPTIRVNKSSGKYYKYDKSHLRSTEDRRAPGSGTHETEYGMAAKGTYQTTEHALKQLVPDEIQAQADSPLNPRVDATEALTEKLMIGKEERLASYMQDTGNLTNNVTLSGTDQWSDYSDSDPIGDIKTARQNVHSSILKKPNTLLLGKEVYDALLDHPDVIDRVKYSQFGAATTDILARLFDVENVIVGQTGYNDSDEGGTDSLEYIWGKHAWVLYVEPNPTIKSVSFGYYFKDADREVDRWYDQDRRGTFIRVRDSYDRGIVTDDAAYLIEDAVA
ncbi:MAG: major capsid protein [archaeon]